MMSCLSYKTRMRLWSVLHPVRTLKALYFIHHIENTDEWKKLVETNPRKAFDMKWNRFYRRKFPWKNPRTLNEKLTWMEVYTDTSKWTEYTDKYEVRKHIESLGLKDILTECYRFGIGQRISILTNSLISLCWNARTIVAVPSLFATRAKWTSSQLLTSSINMSPSGMVMTRANHTIHPSSHV